jgi:5-methylcytosine-specific restriction endonuclease McrA
MIRGSGFEENFVSLIEDLKFTALKHYSVRKYVQRLGRIHQNYFRLYSNCPVAKNNSLTYLPAAYDNSWKTLHDHFYHKVFSNYCCYCGKNRPTRLDHFHPSSKTPQYSLLRYNLIRSCVRCNEFKTSRRPISYLGLKHPYFDRVYKKHEILFEVKIARVYRDPQREIAFDVDVVAKSKLSRNDRADINFALEKMEIKNRVGFDVSIELANIYNVDWAGFRGNEKRRKALFIQMAANELKKKHYFEYFCYKALASVTMIRKIDSV